MFYTLMNDNNMNVNPGSDHKKAMHIHPR